MFIRLNLLRSHQRYHHQNHYQWPRKLLKSYTSAPNSLLRQRHYCDIKRNEELLLSSHGSSVIIPTPLKIKQTIKIGFYDFIDGFACIQTSCPACPITAATAITAKSKIDDKAQTTGDKCLFINKTTGKLVFVYFFVSIYHTCHI